MYDIKPSNDNLLVKLIDEPKTRVILGVYYMGMPGPFRNCSTSTQQKCCSCGSIETIKIESKNPNPSNFTVVAAKVSGRCLIAEIIYPDATNFEGRKIIVFNNRTIKWLLEQKEIDPHFSENGLIIARFVPTKSGWKMAEDFAKTVD